MRKFNLREVVQFLVIVIYYCITFIIVLKLHEHNGLINSGKAFVKTPITIIIIIGQYFFMTFGGGFIDGLFDKCKNKSK